eukprot:5334324-Pleurochrysis_carterae.AAC.1
MGGNFVDNFSDKELAVRSPLMSSRVVSVFKLLTRANPAQWSHTSARSASEPSYFTTVSDGHHMLICEHKGKTIELSVLACAQTCSFEQFLNCGVKLRSSPRGASSRALKSEQQQAARTKSNGKQPNRADHFKRAD